MTLSRFYEHCLFYLDHLAVQVLWDFDSSAQDWARASPTEMDAEVQWGPSGTLRGTVRGPMPHLDSPPFRVRVNDRCHVVIRMRSSGAGVRGFLLEEHPLV